MLHVGWFEVFALLALIGSQVIVVYIVVAAGDSDKTEKVFQEMLSRKLRPSLATYRALVKLRALNGDVQAVRDVLDRMDSEGRPPDVHCSRAFISACDNA